MTSLKPKVFKSGDYWGVIVTHGCEMVTQRANTWAEAIEWALTEGQVHAELFRLHAYWWIDQPVPTLESARRNVEERWNAEQMI